MELRHLRSFVAIAEERSFTRAAERLWVAQPGLSTQIRRLERELGVQLFERHARGVYLTDAGELFLERARAALAAAEVARATGDDIESGTLGSVRLGLSSAPRWGGAAELLDAFAHARPAVEGSVLESYGGAVGRGGGGGGFGAGSRGGATSRHAGAVDLRLARVSRGRARE